jgi:hypothetical protein
VILPWGSLLAAVALPAPAGLAAIRGLCRAGARITVVLGADPSRDRGEAARLALPSSSPVERLPEITAGYAAAGFTLAGLREMGPAELAPWPSTWARRLSHGRGRRFWLLEGRAEGGP